MVDEKLIAEFLVNKLRLTFELIEIQNIRTDGANCIIQYDYWDVPQPDEIINVWEVLNFLYNKSSI